MDTAERNYAQAVVWRATMQTRIAHDILAAFDVPEVTEKLAWALDFQRVALMKLGGSEDNPDGTTGPERVTSEGIELGPPKG